MKRKTAARRQGLKEMIFGKAKPKLPETREEYEAATSRLAAIIQTDITEPDIPSGDPLLLLIYEGGFMRAKFPNGNVGEVQCPDVETAIQDGRDGAIAVNAACGSCRSPRIEVRHVPATGPSIRLVALNRHG